MTASPALETAAAAPSARPNRAAVAGSRGEQIWVVVTLVLLILFGAAGRSLPLVAPLEARFDDARITTLAPAVPLHPKVAIVEIGEDSVDHMRQRAPIDRVFLARLLAALDAAHPASIGIDILFDEHTDPASDEVLRQQLARMTVPVLLATGNATLDPGLETAAQQRWAENFFAGIGNPLVRRAHVRLPPDADDVIRRLPRLVQPWPGGGVLPALSAGTIAAAGWRFSAEGGRIAWYGTYAPHPADRFVEIPAYLLADGGIAAKILATPLAGRIVLVGSFLSDADRHDIPFSSIYGSTVPGVVIQASIVAQLLDGRWLRSPGGIGLVLLAGIAVAAGFTIGAHLDNDWLAGLLLIGIALLIVAFGIGSYMVPIDGGKGHLLFPIVSPSLAAMMATALGYALTRRRFRAQRNFIRGAFSKFVSPSVAKELIAHPELLQVGGERRVITALFTDIEGFTTLSESLDPTVLADLLNRYLSGMTAIVHQYDGTLDKYIGDAVVALWGAPLPETNHAARAIACAVALSRFAGDFAEEQRAKGIGFGRTRIGIHSGAAIVGNFGGEERLQYTAIGDTINSASRLEGANKYLGTHILIGASAALSSGRPDLRPVADLLVKGKEDALTVFEPVPDWSAETLELYRTAYRLLEADAPEAAAALEVPPLRADPVSRLHLGRLRNGERGVRIVLHDK